MDRSTNVDQYLVTMQAELEGLPGRVLAERVARDCGVELPPSQLRVRLERITLRQAEARL